MSSEKSTLKKQYRNYTEQFLKYLTVEKQGSPHTVSNYRRDLRAFEEFIADDEQCSLDELGSRTCRHFLYSLNQRNLSNTSIARRLAALRSFWNFLQAKQFVTDNPWEFMATPKLPKKLPKKYFWSLKTLKSAFDPSTLKSTFDDSKEKKHFLVIFLFRPFQL